MSKEVLKLALEALHDSIAITMAKIDLRNKAIKALEEALAKQEQNEPFGWYDMEHGEIRDVEWNRQKPIYEGVWKPLYTTPQQRTWVGLTDEELRQIWYDDAPVEGGTYVDKLRQVEAKLKEKNNGA